MALPGQSSGLQREPLPRPPSPVRPSSPIRPGSRAPANAMRHSSRGRHAGPGCRPRLARPRQTQVGREGSIPGVSLGFRHKWPRTWWRKGSRNGFSRALEAEGLNGLWLESCRCDPALSFRGAGGQLLSRVPCSQRPPAFPGSWSHHPDFCPRVTSPSLTLPPPPCKDLGIPQSPRSRPSRVASAAVER